MALKASDFEKVGRMLADKYGIVVTCGGTDCCTDGKRIKLPSLPTHIDNQKLLGFCRAWLDHEVGHIVGDSDFDLAVEVGKKHGIAGHSILNSLEDVRIEQVMADLWAGCDINLRVGMVEAFKKLDEASNDTERVSRDPNNPMTKADCVKHPLKQITTALYAIGKGYPLPDWIEADIEKIARQADAKFNLAEVASWSTCTADLLPATEWILDKYKQNRDEREQQGEQQPQPTKVKVKISKGGSGGGGMDQEAAEAINNADEIEVEVDDTPGPDGDAGDDADASDKTDGGTDAAPVGLPNVAGGTEPQPEQQDKPAKTPEQIEAEERLVDEVVGGVAKQMAAAIEDELEQTANDNPNEAARTIEPGMDRLEKINHKPSPGEVEAFKRKAARAGGPMRQRLAQLLQSEDRVWWRGGRKRGLPDPKRIAQLATGVATDVLRTRHHHPAPNTACYLMIDGSGSMDGSLIEQAALAAAAFGLVLDICGHKSAISAFVGCTWPNQGYSREQHLKASRCGIRSYGVQFADIKRFNQPFRQCLSRLTALCENYGGGTPLGESIMFAADQLKPRDEKRKVVIAFTDGTPNDQLYAKWACEYCEKRGIEVVLIGIQDDAVKHIHSRHAVCMDIASLGTTTMVELTKALRAAG